MRPTLFVFTGGSLVGYVHLRPVYRGEDAQNGIVQMSDLAAAASADEIIAVWETQDIALACEIPARHEGPGLNILYASATTQLVHCYTYQERKVGRADNGLWSIEPQWTSSGQAQPITGIEPPIAELIELAFQPLPTVLDDALSVAAAHLEDHGYSVRLTA
ncbi:hypothetical protein [Prauserella marina]|nr:hypothetical protein [Prauserella marina]